MIASYPSKEPLRGHVTFVDVTSGEKATLGQILRNFWLGMRTPFLQSLPVAMVLILLYYIVYYYYSKKKARGKSFCDVISGCACTEHASDHANNVTSGHVTSGGVIFGHAYAIVRISLATPLKSYLSCADILQTQIFHKGLPSGIRSRKK
jgi:hypothetical protein